MARASGAVGGGILRFLETFLYALLFCCAAIILGIYSYFLASLTHHNESIAAWKKAVEGISGAAVLYLIFCVLLTCFLGGIPFLAFMGILLDVLFVGGFAAIAYYTRHGASSCKGTVNTPLGTGNGSHYRLACRLNTAAFAVSIIGILLFLVAALVQIALVRHHQKEKRYGPSPANNYTSGSGKRMFWQKKPKNDDSHLKRDAELGAVGAGGLAVADHHHKQHDIRPSHDTAYTDTTAVAGNDLHNTNNTTTTAGHHGGYYTQPQGTGVNPYGYDSAQTNAQTTGTTATGLGGDGYNTSTDPAATTQKQGGFSSMMNKGRTYLNYR